MRAEEESDHGAGGPDVFAAHGGVFEAGHEFEAVFGDVVVEADVGSLIEVARREAGGAFVTELRIEAFGIVGAGELVAASDLEVVGDEVARLEVESDGVTVFAAEAGGDFGHEGSGAFGQNEGGGDAIVETIEVGRVVVGVAMEVTEIKVGGVGAEGFAEIVIAGGEEGVAGIEIGESFAHVSAGRIGEEAGVVSEFVDATEEGDGGGIVCAEHVGHHAALKVVDVAAGDVSVVGEAVLLLPDGERNLFAEGPLDPEFGEAVVEGFEVAAANHLGVEAEFFEEAGLEADAVAAGFEGIVLAGGAVGPVVLAVVTAEEPKLLEDGIGVALVEATEVFPFFAEGGGGGEGG